jgi:hypothetical protein
MEVQGPEDTQWVEMCGRKVPRSVVCGVLRLLDRRSLAAMAQVSRIFRQMTNDPTVFNTSAQYSGPNTGLPELQRVVPFPPPALVGTTLPSDTSVNVHPAMVTDIPAATSVFVPVLPEAVPMFAQVPDVVVEQQRPGEERGRQKVQISQILPGYAPSYATDYVPPEVTGHSFSAFANTISFNVSRYPTLSEVVDSKAYTKRKSSEPEPKPEVEGSGPPEELRPIPAARRESSSPVSGHRLIDYVPAEYFRGESQARPSTMTISAANRVDFVRPDVLASGRLLTNMTSRTTASETTLVPVLAEVPISTSTLTMTKGATNGTAH